MNLSERAGMSQAGQVPRAVQERIPGTLERAQDALKRLYQLRDSLKIVNHNLHGPRPEDANEKAPAPSNLVHYVDSIHDLLEACESEVRDIYKSLGIA